MPECEKDRLNTSKKEEVLEKNDRVLHYCNTVNVRPAFG